MGFRCSKTRGFPMGCIRVSPPKNRGLMGLGLFCGVQNSGHLEQIHLSRVFPHKLTHLDQWIEGSAEVLTKAYFLDSSQSTSCFIVWNHSLLITYLDLRCCDDLFLFVARTRRLSLVHIPQTLCFSEITLPNSEWQLVCFSSISINMFAG